MSLLRRQLLNAALTANAIRPVKTGFASVPSFALGWLASELAPQLLAATALDAVQATVRGRASKAGLALAALNSVGLAYVIGRAVNSGLVAEKAIRQGIGDNYQTAMLPVPDDDTWKVLAPAVARPFRLRFPDVEVIRDLPYQAGGSRALLDIYRPKGVELAHAPVLFQIHGGGWTIGDKSQQGLLLMNRMARLGWVCVAINYRLSPKHSFPAHIIDVKKALAWVKDNIHMYGGDPKYVVTTGGSAGGHLAALAALTPNLATYQPGFENADTSVSACVPFYGVYDLAGITGDKAAIMLRDRFLAPRVFQQSPHTDIAPFELASPLTHVNEAAPDFLIVHGTYDSLVSVHQAHAFVEKLQRVSQSTVTYIELPGTQHAFEVFSSIRSQKVIRAVARWLQWHRTQHHVVELEKS